jgi:nucleoside-diphosphate-sugar epimerase
MKILFIGGTGIISSACSNQAVKRGLEVYLLNRGQTTFRPVPEGAHTLLADIRNVDSVRKVIQDLCFDAVVDWVAFTPEQVAMDLELFRGRTGQYVFISSASVYQTPPVLLPVTESTPLDNPIWEYSQNKIDCEELLIKAYRDEKFPMTIVRPSHTYDKTYIPLDGSYTALDRMRRGKEIIVHGDGTSLWTLTHHEDFARGFLGLLGNSHAIGETFHITSDEWLSWNQIVEILANAAGVTPRIIHVPSEFIAAFDRNWGDGLLGDKANSMIFDNSKIKRAVPGFTASIPFTQGAREMIAWHDAHPERQAINHEFNLLCDRIISAYRSAWPV